MKKKKVITSAVVISAFLTATVFAAADSDEKIVRNLINERTLTLSSYYDGDMKKEEAVEIIKRLETDNLMEQDLDNIDRYFQTDIDRIKEFELRKIEIRESDDDMICAEVSIKWDVETLSGSDSFICDYDVICIKDGDKYKLVQFF